MKNPRMTLVTESTNITIGGRLLLTSLIMEKLFLTQDDNLN